MTNELDEKTGRLTAMLAAERLDAVLLNSQHNFAWLTGGGANGIDLSRENGAASLLVAASGKRFVLANNIEMPRLLAEEVSAADFEPVEYSWQHEKTSGTSVVDMAKALIGGEIATDLAIENKIAGCRYQLTINEIERFLGLGHDAGVAIKNAINNVSPGESELEIAETLRHELAVNGMTSVVTLVAADERIAQYRHPVPSEKRWKKTLLMVTCAKRGGLIVSLSRLICVGDIPDELERKTKAAAYINACLLDATRPGATGAGLYQTAAAAYAEQGSANEIDRHHQGGAAGYKTRDWVAHPQSTEVVLIDQAFAWNPSITGTKVEETCIALQDGARTITASPDFPQIVTTIDGREYFSPGILSL